MLDEKTIHKVLECEHEPISIYFVILSEQTSMWRKMAKTMSFLNKFAMVSQSSKFCLLGIVIFSKNISELIDLFQF